MLDLRRAEHEGTTGLARRQASRLAALLVHARSSSRFYQRLYGGLPADGVALPDLPPVNKRQLMAAFDDWLTDPGITRAGVEAFIHDPSLIGTPYHGECFVCTSSGTTGDPGIFVSDRGAIDIYRAINAARVTPAWFDAHGLLRLAGHGFRWAAVLGTGAHYVGASWLAWERRRSGWRSRGIRVFPVQQPIAALVSELNAFNPALLTGYPSALEILAEEQSAGRLDLNPVMVELSGESTTQQASARISAAFGCTVRKLYAASECPFMAFSCDHDWLHVNSDWVVLEPVDEDFRPTPPGQPSHTVLLTNLANWVQPLIRYDLGDSVLVRPDPCPCGCVLPAIRVAGRCDDVLRLTATDGRTVKILPLAIGAVVDETPGVQRGQMLQTGPATIRLRLELKTGVDAESVWCDVIANLKGYLAGQHLASVEVVRASESPEQDTRFGKFRQVIAVPRGSHRTPIAVHGHP